MIRPADDVRYDDGGWISGPSGWSRQDCGDRKRAGESGAGHVVCCLDPDHVKRDEDHESVSHYWNDAMMFARAKEDLSR